ncbi:thymidine kinase [Candidatus Pacearchaeota archaeon]|nr:MAG: thymidine kinase [Candidatus Pacearchaeota archaeon]
MISPLILPGVFEIYVGCMKSGKSRALINRLDELARVPNCQIRVFKPETDKRNVGVFSRFGKLRLDCTRIPSKEPSRILDEIDESVDVIGIDEVNFFTRDIAEVVSYLTFQKKHIIASGLDLNFRGEPFESTKELLPIATYVHKLTGVCEYPECGRRATRTQRLINGKPAPYGSDLIAIEGIGAEYQCRCIWHHEVPRNPN